MAQCSAECRKEAARARARAWYDEHRDDPNLKARVAESGRQSYDRVKADAESWAGRLERTREWRAANPEKVRAGERAWREANADRVRAKVQRRRGRLLGAFVADVDPTEVWIRDEGIRHICEVAIDPDLPWPHKFSKTLDHVVPLAKGGTHQPENVRLAHAVCNSRKNDRTA